MEWYNKYRPRKLKYVYGQSDAIRDLRLLLKRGFPHAILLYGQSGGGKTTIVRILARSLECGDSDFIEVNVADFKGIDTIREIRNSIHLAPFGTSRVVLLDECHKLTNDAQTALLKLLESSTKEVYYFLCTTDSRKLIPELRSRCQKIQIKPMSVEAIGQVLKRVARKEKFVLLQKVSDRIAEVCEGNAREAIQILQRVSALKTEKEQLDSIYDPEIRKEAIDLCRFIMGWGKKNPDFGEASKIIKNMRENGVDAESVRRVVLDYATTILLSNSPMAEKAYQVIVAFEDPPFYNSGFAGLARACRDVCAKT